MALDYFKQPSLKKMKTLKNTDNSVVKIMLLLLVFIIPFNGCKKCLFFIPKSLLAEKKSSLLILTIFLKGELQLPLR